MAGTIDTQGSKAAAFAQWPSAVEAKDLQSSEPIAVLASPPAETASKVSLSWTFGEDTNDVSGQLYSPEGLAKKAGAAQATGTREGNGILPVPDIASFEADASLPRAELYAKYEKAVSSLNLPTQAALDRANAEVPDSDDPERLAQAERATAYVHNKGGSPFGAVSRNTLAAIYYDYSGRYTYNERIAAAKQMNEMDKQFWDPLTQKAGASGDWREVAKAGLAAYDAALPIERMKSPPNYKQLVQRDLDDFNTHEGAAIDEKKRDSLLDMLNALYQREEHIGSAEKRAEAASGR